MNKTLNDFIGEVKAGLAKVSHFDVVIPKPKVVVSNLFDNRTLTKVMMFCDQAQLPGINLSTVPIRHYGEAREMPYEKLYDPVNLSFYVDKDLKIKMFWDEWIQNIQNPYSRTFNYYREYTTNIDIIVYDISNVPRYKVTLFEAYPKTMGQIQLDYNGKDVMKLPITIQYRNWVNTLLTTQGGSSQNNPVNLLPTELRAIGNSGLAVPSVYFDNQAQFQSAFSQATSANFANWWSNLK